MSSISFRQIISVIRNIFTNADARALQVVEPSDAGIRLRITTPAISVALAHLHGTSRLFVIHIKRLMYIIRAKGSAHG